MGRAKPEMVSLFAGIGGFDLGFERAGFKSAFQCEIDPFCNEILAKHWPKTTRHSDIKELDGEAIPTADVWTGGFPCQDVSVARMGSPRKGLKGKRSGLFFEFARLIGERLPRVCVIENVPGLLSAHEGKDFQIIIQTLAELGYGVGWRVYNSRYFGVPQSRQRVYIVGCHRDSFGPRAILFEPECREGDDSPRRENGEKVVSPFRQCFGDTRKGPIVQGIAYCLYACSARHTGTDWSRTYVSYPDGRVRRLMPVECERIQGFPDGWTEPDEDHPELDIDRIDTLRYNALGNAVTVNVAEWLARRVLLYLDATSTKSDLRLVAMSPREAVAVGPHSATLNGHLANGQSGSNRRNGRLRQG